MRKTKFYIWTILVITLVIFTAVLFGGCKKKGEKEENNEPTITPTITITPTVTIPPITHEGEVRSKLTGLWVKEEIGNKRPYAIMFNNIKYASPQSGTSEAGVLYEAIVEGGITRLMGIFEELHETRIGSVRSARHYFVSFADEYNAIYVHFGETTYATKKIKSLGINNLSGLTGVGDTVFYRDKSIKEPHNAFTSREGILKGTEIKGYKTEYDENYESHFKFYEEDTDLVSEEKVNKVTLKFSAYTSPYFTYNTESKLYERFQFGEKHVDANSGEQLAFKNIIVQFVKEWDIDKNDYQTMDIADASGEGYYINNGKKVDITWKKNESTKKMRYYDKSGNELVMNPGKIFIAIFPNDRVSDAHLEE
jgi:hypothetical protein